MTDQDERWALVAAAIERRMSELRLTKAELSRRSGVSEPTLAGYLRGSPIRRRDKRWELCLALEWTPDSVDRLLDGGEAKERDDATSAVILAIEADPQLTPRLKAALRAAYQAAVE